MMISRTCSFLPLLLIVLSCTSPTTNAFSTTKPSQDVAMLSRALRLIYTQGGTLGVLQRCEGIGGFAGDKLVQATLEASRGDKGMASGILNAFLGSYCRQKGTGGHKAVELMRAYDRTASIKPDLVALSLAHVAAVSNDGLDKEAKQFLSRAEGYFDTTLHDNPQQQSAKSPDWAKIEQQHGVRLLQEAPEFVVVSKPSGMVCYHGKEASAKAKHKQKQKNKGKDDLSLEDCLLQNGVPLSTLNKEGRGLVHRLDRGTSGCLVLAKTNRMHADLMARFFLRDISKSYRALVCSNRLPKEGDIDLDIDGRPARSSYRLETKVGSWLSRIKVRTDQGRRHQVRIHCSRGLEAPILLDPLYGGQAILSRFNGKDAMPKLQQWRSQQKFGLHADALVIPYHGIDVVADLPAWWQELEADLA